MPQKISIKEFIDKMNISCPNLTLKIFHFNPIQVNTLIAYDETGEAVIVDPGNYTERESQTLTEFIDNHNLKVKFIINTHPHIDHILGNAYCVNLFKVPLIMHHKGMEIYNQAPEYGENYGFDLDFVPKPDIFVEENETITFGNQSWQVLYTPGHADGSISLYDAQNGFIIVGDVIFLESIGRTDLPTGNFHLLIENIQNKIMSLNDNTIIIPGHGFQTTVEHEKQCNPFLQSFDY